MPSSPAQRVTAAVLPIALRVVRAVSASYGVSQDALRGESRDLMLQEPRRVAMFLLREQAGASYPVIGSFFNRNHSTVIKLLKGMTGADVPPDVRARLASPTAEASEGCPRCRGLLVELASLKLEMIELRARFGGCG